MHFALSRGKRRSGGLGYGRAPARLTPLVASVLIVDDADSIRLLCRVNLELEGHVVHEAPLLDAARRILERERVDVVLLDVHVGAGDGRELLRELRASQPNVRVAILTGSADSRTVRAVGADAVLAKPFELEELRAVVNSLASSPQLSST